MVGPLTCLDDAHTYARLAAVQESQSICSAVGVSVPDFVGCSPYPISSVSSVATSATRTSANAVTSASATQTSAAGGSRSSSKSSSIIPIAIGASLGGAFLAVVCLLLCLRVHKTRRMQQHSQFTITRPDQSRDHAIETPQTPAIELPAGHSVPTFHARSPIEAEEGSPARLQEMTGTSAFQEMLGSTSLHEHHPAFSGESPQDGIQALENGIGPPPYPSSEIPETSRPESVKGIRTAFPVPPSTQQAPAILGQDMRYLYNLESTSSSPVSPARASQLIVSEISEIPVSVFILAAVFGETACYKCRRARTDNTDVTFAFAWYGITARTWHIWVTA